MLEQQAPDLQHRLCAMITMMVVPSTISDNKPVFE